tara:strand:- start:194 stop:1549 length:1356 start_codon:yes stop_codon:yes gene_type:complete
MTLTKELCDIKSGVVCDGNEALFRRIGDELPLKIFRYESGQRHNGWIVPDKWSVREANIYKDDKLLYDGTVNALGVAQYSRSFEGELDLETLKKHLFSIPSLPDAHVFHCNWLYRPWENGWGFCPPHRFVDSLKPGKYRVSLKTTFEPGEMLVAHHHIPGKSDNTIVFQSNTCHPHMANDGFSGTAVMIRFFQWLSERDNYYSYRLILCPEHLGTVFYLRDHTASEIDTYLAGVFGEMMGTDGDMVVASTFKGEEVIDRAFRHIVAQTTTKHRFLGFRESVGNDETVWEAPGYEIPFVQVNRFQTHSEPFWGYHTNYDNIDIIKPELLEEFFIVFQGVIELLENNVLMHRKFDGLVALSNPEYDIYLERFDPSKSAIRDNEYNNKWGVLQDSVVRYFEGNMSVLDIAEKHDLNFFDVRQYIQKFADKDLIDISLQQIRRTPAQRVALEESK